MVRERLWQILRRWIPRGQWPTRQSPQQDAPVCHTTSGQYPSGQTRRSFALEEFLRIPGAQTCTGNRRILDLGGASQQNVTFLASRGFLFHALDLLNLLDQTFDPPEFFSAQLKPELQQKLLQEGFQFPENYFDGILAWDHLQFLVPPLLTEVMGLLHNMLKPHGTLLTIFHSASRPTPICTYSYRILDQRTLLLLPRTTRPPAKIYNNRELERLFAKFATVKFYLSRDQLREIVARK